MSTSRITGLVLMIIGLVLCAFILSGGITFWLLVGFLVSYGLISISRGSTSALMLIFTTVGGIVLFWLFLGWQAALAYFLLSCAFAFVQPNAA
jgi:hypothetical protein